MTFYNGHLEYVLFKIRHNEAALDFQPFNESFGARLSVFDPDNEDIDKG